jgi:hypothetical protein
MKTPSYPSRSVASGGTQQKRRFGEAGRTGLDRRVLWLLAGGVAIVACRFVVRRGPDQNWDLLNYHYYTGYAFVHGRLAEDVLPAAWVSYVNPLPNVVTYLAYANLPFPFSSLTILALQLLCVPLLVLIGREVARGLGRTRVTASEVAALGLGLLAPLWWSELGTSFYSSTTAPLALAGLWLLLTGTRSECSSRDGLGRTLGAGALMGLATSLKLTNAFFAVGGAFALVPALLAGHRGWRLRRVLAYAAGAGIGFAVCGWWYLRVAREWGSPLFPLYNAIFQSPYYDPVDWTDTRYAFHSLAAFVRFPAVAAAGTTSTSEIGFADARYLLCAAIAMAAVALRAYRTPEERRSIGAAPATLLWFAAGGFVAWSVVFPYQRYLIPIELLLGLVAWILLAAFIDRDRWLAACLGICVVVSLVLIRVPDWGHGRPAPGSQNAFGLDLPPELASGPAEYLVVGVPNAYILAFLDPRSHFYRIDFSRKLLPRIIEGLARNKDRPVRVIAQAKATVPLPTLRNLGFEAPTSCIDFTAGAGAYFTCELRHRAGQ